MLSVFRRLPIVLLMLGLASSAAAQTVSIPGPWWKTDPIKKELGLTHEQSIKLDRIWSDFLPQTRDRVEQLDQYETRLSRLIETDADEVDVLKQVDKIGLLQATISKTRVQMLIRMRNVLTPDQRAMMNVIMDRYDAAQKARQAQQVQLNQAQSSRPGSPSQRASPPASATDPHRKPD